MLDSLHGIVLSRSPGALVVETGGFGLRVRVPVETAAAATAGIEVRLSCHLLLRDDQFHLYGFATALEREVFLILLGVAGLGPERAIGLLGALSPAAIAAAVQAGDARTFQVVRGIGTRLGQRIALELKGKLDDLPLEPLPAFPSVADRTVQDAVATLAQLGYPRLTAERATRAALDGAGSSATVEDLVKAALRALQKPA